MKILTVSIAAYNVEQYLDFTLRSICDSGFLEDIEVLVIDDGSTDRTGEIAKRYERMCPDTIHYIAKENGGHGSTINKGVELAKGKYFRVVDGDDAVDSQEFANYVRQLKECDADVVITDYWWIDEKGERFPHNHAVFDRMAVGRTMEYDKSIESSLFGLSTLSIRTELLRKNNVRITAHCYYVDVEFIVWAIAVSRNFIFYKNRVYLYRCVGTSGNSTNKANMLKNVNMQETAALRLCALFNQFQESRMLDEDRGVLILERIEMSIAALYRTWLLCARPEDSKTNIISFEKKIQKVSPEIYRYIGKKSLSNGSAEIDMHMSVS